MTYNMAVYVVGDFLRETRLRKGYTQEEVSYGICTPASLSRIENGAQKPGRLILEKLFERLGTENNLFNSFVSKEEMELYSAIQTLIRNVTDAEIDKIEEMTLDAVQKGCRKFIIGIGGSATTEGGIGMLSALGYDFMDENGDILPPVFASLEKVVQIENNRVPEVLKDCHFQIACDVTNPLCGVGGCVYVFGAQKGVKEEEKESMDRAMQSYAACLEKFTGKKLSDIPGTGAAGGLGFAFLWGLPNVELKPGIDIVLEAVGLASELQDADIVVTGEGCLDFQTAMGKVPVGVAKAAKQYGCEVIAFAGSVTEEAIKCNEKGIDAFFSILPGVCSLDEAMNTETAQKNMRNAAEQVFRLVLDLYEHKT